MNAYDYEAQRWVDGSEARLILLRQAKQDLEILRGPRAAQFAAFSGIRDVAEAVRHCESEIARLESAK